MTQEKRILIIDDDRDIRESLKEILMDEGFSVFTAENGKEALSFLLDAVNPRPKLILVALVKICVYTRRPDSSGIYSFLI